MVKVFGYGMFIGCLLLSLSVAAENTVDDPEVKNPDPWEGVNRVTHKFNDVTDRILLKPVAKGYKKVVPDQVQFRVGRFFSNLDEISNATNNVLQGKFKYGATSLGRFVLNSTIGVVGLFDPAADFGLAAHEEDFGQTFRVWGIPKGPYLVIPFLGPSTVTDTVARPFDSRLGPLRYYYPVDHRNILYGINLIDARASFLSAESAVFGDRYLFYREAYLQRRDYLANDGQVKDDFDDF
jgi:phospholipid-binding lipoprotein MlaA